MYSSDIIDLSDIQFSSNPFPHFSSHSVFKNGVEAKIHSWFESTDLWQYTETNFYTQYEFSLMETILPEALKELKSVETIRFISSTLKKVFNAESLTLVGLTAHKLLDGYKMGVHNDFIGKDESHRLVVQLNPGWTQENGGFLMMFHSSSPHDVSRIVQPLNNSAIAFRISEKSYHAVSTIHNFTRYTLVYTFNEGS